MAASEKRSRWRHHLKPEEAEKLAELEQEAAAIDSRRRRISADVHLIRQRCYQRWVQAGRQVA